MASSAVRLATRSSSCCCWATSRWYLVERRIGRRSRVRPDLLAGQQIFLEPVDQQLPLDQRRLAADHGLFERLRLLPLLARLALGIGQQLVSFLLRVEDGFFLPGLGVPLGVLDDPERLLFGAADRFGGDPLSVGDPHGEHGRCRPRP